MADNTTLNAGSGGDVIATDDISSVKYQRVKLTLGADGVNDGDVSSSNPIPSTTADIVASGTITAQNAAPTGNSPTANSTVATGDLTGIGTLTIQLTGTFSATMGIYATLDDSTWVQIQATQLIGNTGFASSTMTTASIWTMPCSGYRKVRVNCNSFSSGSVQVYIRGTIGSNGLVQATLPISAASSIPVAGPTADDSPASGSGNPVVQGLVARTTNRAAVADADVVRAMSDDVGRQVVVTGQVRDLMVHQHTQIASSSAETTILTAGAAGVFHDLTQLVITNQTATAVNCTLKDATAGTTRMIIALAASGGAVIPFARPMTQSAAANNWTITLSSSAVTVNIFAQAEKNV